MAEQWPNGYNPHTGEIDGPMSAEQIAEVAAAEIDHLKAKLAQLEAENEKLKGKGASSIVGRKYHEGVIATLEAKLAEKDEAIQSWKAWHREIADALGAEVIVRSETTRRVTVLKAENERARELLNRIGEWCDQHGRELTPAAGQCDSYGDGMREAKRRVREILTEREQKADDGEEPGK